MKALQVRAVFLAAMLGAALVVGVGYYFAWVYVLAELSRAHMFVLSWGLILVHGLAGVVAEDRLEDRRAAELHDGLDAIRVADEVLAEDPDGMVDLGFTEKDEVVQINKRAAESDLVIYVNINLVAFGQALQDITGQVFALFVIAVAAAEVGVGLAIVLAIYRNRRSVDLAEL